LCEILRGIRESAAPLDDDGRQLAEQLERLKAPAAAIAETADVAWRPDEIVSVSSVVTLCVDSKANPIALKTARRGGSGESIRREAAVLERLKHPFVVELRGPISATPTPQASIATAYAWHGSLASHHPPKARLRGPNRIAKVVAGIALAMRFVHSRGVIHRDLSPENVLLDWDWSVRIADFGHSTALATRECPDGNALSLSINSRYLAPECYDGTFLQASDVFAFGLILFEILTGCPAFPVTLSVCKIAFIVAVEGARPEIPDSVLPPARQLITDCLAAEPDDRPTFEEIVDRLTEMRFKVTAHVNSAKVAAFVERVEAAETGAMAATSNS
jgi:serine/threonine protein kinase